MNLNHPAGRNTTFHSPKSLEFSYRFRQTSPGLKQFLAMSQKGIFLTSHISLHLHSTQLGFAQPRRCPAVTPCPFMEGFLAGYSTGLCSRGPEHSNTVGKASIRLCNPQLFRLYFPCQEILSGNVVPSKIKPNHNRISSSSSTVGRRCVSAKEVVLGSTPCP